MKNFVFDLQRFAEDEGYLKDNLIGFVPTPQATEIVKNVVRGSSVLRLAKLEQMASDKKKIPVMTSGPGAYWVGETERIRTSVATWIFPQLEAKKLAVIIPMTKEKMDDTTINVFEEMKPYVQEAFHKAIDVACLFGINSPFKRNIFSAVSDVGNVVVAGTNGAGALDLDISDTMALVEAAGHDVNGFAADHSFKNSLRKLRDKNGNQLYVTGVNDEQLYSLPIEFGRNGAWDKTKVTAFAGNWNFALAGIRKEIEYSILTEATLHTVTMADGKPLSLAEQDMVALKATMRIGFLPIKEDAFAALVPKTAASEGGV